MSKKGMVLVSLLPFVLLTPLLLAEEDHITITTYYPSPYGVYRTLRLHPSTRSAATCNEGELYYDKGDTGNPKGVYFCNANHQWAQLQAAAPTGIWIGGGKLTQAQDELYYKYAAYFSPPKGWNSWYTLSHYCRPPKDKGPDGESPAPEIIFVDPGNQTGYLQLTVTGAGNLTAGTYKIEYGGGTVKFFMGKKFTLEVWIYKHDWGSWYKQDSFDLINPAAIDGKPCNFGDPAVATVNIPKRSLTYQLASTWVLAVAIRAMPQYEVLDWAAEIGPQLNQLAWEDVKRDLGAGPSFSPSPGGCALLPGYDYRCNANMSSQYCGEALTGCAACTNCSWETYKWSAEHMRILNSYAGGTFSDFEIDFYKLD